MTCPILFVHGIGDVNDNRELYYQSWVEYFGYPGFHYMNASWHAEAFNVSYGSEIVDPRFSSVSGRSALELSNMPFMERAVHYFRSKARAVRDRTMAEPLGRWNPFSRFNRRVYDYFSTRVLDYIGDVFAYLDWESYTKYPPEVGNPILSSVEDKLDLALELYPTTPIHIISHSLGTKIVWDALTCRDIAEGRIGVWLTMGSPLQAMKIFRLARSEDNEFFRKPACVDHWLNIYDIKDPIGGPIGGASFRTASGKFRSIDELLAGEGLFPCANVCATVGWFPWTSHTNYFKNKKIKKLFWKYAQKYDNETTQTSIS